MEHHQLNGKMSLLEIDTFQLDTEPLMAFSDFTAYFLIWCLSH